MVLPFVVLLAVAASAQWTPVSVHGHMEGRDEMGSFGWKGQMCLFGGRHNQTIDCFDPATSTWTNSKTVTQDIHHVQPIVYKDEVYVVAAWHGPYPAGERQIPNILIYNPDKDTLREGCPIPKEFARGAAGCVLYQDMFYIVNGAVDGHVKADGAYAYRNFTRFNPATCEWTQLPTRPRYNRDHFQAVVVGTKLIIAGGRDSPHGANVFKYTVGPVEWYDFATGGEWHEGANITTLRAGAANIVDSKGGVVVLGGETSLQKAALKVVERYDIETNTWTSLHEMLVGRHTSGLGLFPTKTGHVMVTAGGVGNMGGSPLLTDTEEIVYHA